jgi:hypothetical protein
MVKNDVQLKGLISETVTMLQAEEQQATQQLAAADFAFATAAVVLAVAAAVEATGPGPELAAVGRGTVAACTRLAAAERLVGQLELVPAASSSCTAAAIALPLAAVAAGERANPQLESAVLPLSDDDCDDDGGCFGNDARGGAASAHLHLFHQTMTLKAKST